MERYLLAVEGFTVTLELKRMRTLRLRVRPEGIFLSAPFGTPHARLSEFVRENAAWLRRAMERVERRKKTMQAEVPLSREEIKAFADDFKPRFERWQEAMGLRATRVTFKLMKSRWGSCNPATRRISINVRLCRYPAECTDYVIVHELSHLVHPDHSAAFWELVEKYIPHRRLLTKMLREPR